MQRGDLALVPPPTTSDEEGVSADRWLGRELGGRYKLLSLLGRGSAGFVFRAIQSPLGRVVAVKVLRPDLSPYAKREFGRRFIREAAVVSRLSHPNIVVVHDYGVDDDDTHFVVMELLKGRTLRRALREGRFDERKTIQVSQGICKGLRHAHAQGVIHRDIKPGNIFLITNEDGDEVPILLDFGIVKLLEGENDDATAAGTYLGTPAYMSPEQAMSDASVDHRADLYSLGCLMFRMLSGERPYGSGNALAMALKHQRKPLPKFSTIRPVVHVSDELEAVVHRAMAKRAEARFEDALAMFNALEQVRTGSAKRDATSRSFVVFSVALLAAVTLLSILWANRGPDEEAPVDPMTAIQFQPSEAQLEPVDDAKEASTVPTNAQPIERPTAQAAAPVQQDTPKPLTPKAKPSPQATQELKPTTSAPSVAPQPVLPKPKANENLSNEPEPVPKPAQKSEKEGQRVVVDGIYMTGEQAAKTLQFVNTASEEDLRASGMVSRSVGVVLTSRPFESLESFGTTSYIGPKTVESAMRAANTE